MTTTLLSMSLDRLAKVKIELDALRKEEAELKDFLIDSGETFIESDEHRCLISLTTRTIVDWKTVAFKAGASRQLVQAYTTKGEPSYRVVVNIKK